MDTGGRAPHPKESCHQVDGLPPASKSTGEFIPGSALRKRVVNSVLGRRRGWGGWCWPRSRVAARPRFDPEVGVLFSAVVFLVQSLLGCFWVSPLGSFLGGLFGKLDWGACVGGLA
jgi:hypothetical protein